MSRFAPIKRLVPVAAVALVVSLLGGSFASAAGPFSDVGDTHPFKDEIQAIVQAGITTGYNDGTYRPAAPVTRGAMAAFMARGFGRINSAAGTANNPADNTNTQLGVASIRSGAESGTGGYVHLTADAQMSVTVAECQCVLVLEIVDQATNTVVATRTSMSNTFNVLGINTQSVSAGGVVQIPANVTRTYQLRVRATTAGNNDSITLSGRIVATYVPFNAFGNMP